MKQFRLPSSAVAHLSSMCAEIYPYLQHPRGLFTSRLNDTPATPPFKYERASHSGSGVSALGSDTLVKGDGEQVVSQEALCLLLRRATQGACTTNQTIDYKGYQKRIEFQLTAAQRNLFSQCAYEQGN